mgnify:CR=1 FL=1
MREDVNSKANIEDIAIIRDECIEIKKSIGGFVSSKEMMSRIDTISHEIQKKLDDRPTKGWVHKYLKTYDDKIDSCVKTVESNTKLMIKI